MPDYDFQILQPNEFECLTRDLLQKKERLFIESFTSGRDDGIDLRFAYASPRGSTIVQVKRYKDYDTLIRSLKREVFKVKQLKPRRYILSTSVGLTPKNKVEIANLFAPFILSTSDILGRDDINNLLGQYHDIENQYYKLWISSTNVMDRILHRRIENWAGFELDEIKKDVATYVMNDSFNKAMSILLKNRFVIISGIPGIGKTTLARMLVYKLLGEDYEEVIRVSSMEDAAEKFRDNIRQVFFFDDFLGANYFHVTEDSFENKVLRFIDAVRSKPDKLFILSTREYILKSALRQFEHFAIKNIELARCTLDLEDYTESVRAHILYNHLAEAEISTEYARRLLIGAQYMKIIKHKNFNPRIIEAFLNKSLYLQVPPERFVKTFLEFFDHPDSVWDYAFRNVPSLAQYALLVRVTMGNGGAYLEDWYKAMKSFVGKTRNELSLSITEISWEEIHKVLEGSFILTTPFRSSLVTCFHNPSVFDFLLDKVRAYKDIQSMLIISAVFVDQVFNTFSDLPITDVHQHIQIDTNLYPAVKAAYHYGLKNLVMCGMKVTGSFFYKEGINVVSYVLKMQKAFPVLFKREPQLLYSVATQDTLENGKISLLDRMTLLSHLDKEGCQMIDLEHLASVVYEEADWTIDFVNILDLLEKTSFGQAALECGEVLQRVEEALDAELDSADCEADCDMVGDTASDLADRLPGLNLSAWIDAVEEAKQRFTKEPEEDVDEDWARETFYRSRSDVDTTYVELFSSLLGQ